MELFRVIYKANGIIGNAREIKITYAQEYKEGAFSLKLSGG